MSSDLCACGRLAIGICQLCQQATCDIHSAPTSFYTADPQTGHTFGPFYPGVEEAWPSFRKAAGGSVAKDLAASGALFHRTCMAERVAVAANEATPPTHSLPDDPVDMLLATWTHEELRRYGLDGDSEGARVREIRADAATRVKDRFVSDSDAARQIASRIMEWVVTRRHARRHFQSDGWLEFGRDVYSQRRQQVNGGGEVTLDMEYTAYLANKDGDLQRLDLRNKGGFFRSDTPVIKQSPLEPSGDVFDRLYRFMASESSYQ